MPAYAWNYNDGAGLQYASEDRATAALEMTFHTGGAYLMARILISTFGCANGSSLLPACILRDEQGWIVLQVGLKIEKRYRHRQRGCWLAMDRRVVCLGSWPVADYIFAVLVFYILTIVGMFVLRFKQPTPGHTRRSDPILPATL
jgi:APA family basic amino acid/polyamine antiporter